MNAERFIKGFGVELELMTYRINRAVTVMVIRETQNLIVVRLGSQSVMIPSRHLSLS